MVGERVEKEGDGQGEDGGEEGQEAPGELEVGEIGEMLPDGGRERGEEEGDDCGEKGQGADERCGGGGGPGVGSDAEGDESGGGEGEEEESEEADGLVDGVVGRVGGVGEEEVVLVTQGGNDGHGGLDEAALVGCGEEIDGGEG